LFFKLRKPKWLQIRLKFHYNFFHVLQNAMVHGKSSVSQSVLRRPRMKRKQDFPYLILRYFLPPFVCSGSKEFKFTFTHASHTKACIHLWNGNISSLKCWERWIDEMKQDSLFKYKRDPMVSDLWVSELLRGSLCTFVTRAQIKSTINIIIPKNHV